MPTPTVPVDVKVQDESGVEVGRATIHIPDEPGGVGRQKFPNLRPGTYTCTASPPKEYEVQPENPWKQQVTPGMDGLDIELRKFGSGFTIPSAKPEPQSPPWLRLAGVAGAAAAVLTGSIPAPSLTSLFSQASQPAQSTFVSGSNRTTFRNQADDELPRDLKERFKACLEEGFKTVSGVSGLTESDSEESVSDEEFSDQLIASYSAISDVRATIEDCDPTLLLEIAAVDLEDSALSPSTVSTSNFNQPVVTIIGEDVNVRAEPSLDGAVIGQVSGGEVQIDLAALNRLSPEELGLIEVGEGWLPVVLADGGTGFIYSAYVDASGTLH